MDILWKNHYYCYFYYYYLGQEQITAFWAIEGRDRKVSIWITSLTHYFVLHPPYYCRYYHITTSSRYIIKKPFNIYSTSSSGPEFLLVKENVSCGFNHITRLVSVQWTRPQMTFLFKKYFRCFLLYSFQK